MPSTKVWQRSQALSTQRCIRCQTKDYILDIVAAHAGMRINKVNSVIIILNYIYYTYCVNVCTIS